MHDLITFALGASCGFTTTVGVLAYRVLKAAQDAPRGGQR